MSAAGRWPIPPVGGVLSDDSARETPEGKQTVFHRLQRSSLLTNLS